MHEGEKTAQKEDDLSFSTSKAMEGSLQMSVTIKPKRRVAVLKLFV